MNVYLGRWDSDNMWRDSCGGDHSSWWEILASDRSPRRRLKQNAFGLYRWSHLSGLWWLHIFTNAGLLTRKRPNRQWWMRGSYPVVLLHGGCRVSRCGRRGRSLDLFLNVNLRLADRLRFQLHSCWLKLHLYFWLRLGLWGYRHLFMRPLGLHAVNTQTCMKFANSHLTLRESYRIEIDF